jgi:hypothetical protein
MNELRLALEVSDSKTIILISDLFTLVSNDIRCPLHLTRHGVGKKRNAIDNKKVELYTAIESANAH